MIKRKKMTDRSKTIIGLHTAVFLAGGTGLFGRFVSISGLPLVWFRMMVAVVTLVVAMALLGKLHKVPFKSILPISLCGAILALHWTAFFASIQASNVSVGVVCIATSCFFTTFLDPLINKKRISLVGLLISFISIAGALVIFSLDIRYRLGIALGLLSAALYALFSILNIRAANKTGEDSSTMLLYELLGGIIFLSLCVPILSIVSPETAIAPSGKDMMYIALLGSIFTVIPFLLQIHALKSLSAFTVNISYNLEPIYSIILAAILFGETKEVNASFWVGLCLIVISVVLQTIRNKRTGK